MVRVEVSGGPPELGRVGDLLKLPELPLQPVDEDIQLFSQTGG